MVKGKKHVRHFQGVPYVDNGAEATVTLADGTEMPVPVKTISNTVPPGCKKIGQYEIEYEALGPDAYGTPLRGNRTTACRVVEIGIFVVGNVVSLDCRVALACLIGCWNRSFHRNLVYLLCVQYMNRY